MPFRFSGAGAVRPPVRPDLSPETCSGPGKRRIRKIRDPLGRESRTPGKNVNFLFFGEGDAESDAVSFRIRRIDTAVDVIDRRVGAFEVAAPLVAVVLPRRKPFGTRSSRGVRFRSGRFLSVRPFPVVHPFIDVAAHVVDAQLVGLLGPHGVRLLVLRVVPVPGDFVGVVAAGIHVVFRPVAAACRELPFGVGRQTVARGRGVVVNYDGRGDASASLLVGDLFEPVGRFEPLDFAQPVAELRSVVP